MIQPFSYLIVSNAFKEIPTGETLEILMNGPNDVADLLKILPAASYTMVPMEEQKGAAAGFRLQLKKIVIRHDGTGISRTGNLTQ
jgi:TusA-related sulfurtransferase